MARLRLQSICHFTRIPNSSRAPPYGPSLIRREIFHSIGPRPEGFNFQLVPRVSTSTTWETDSSSGGQNGSTVSAKHHDNRCWPTERTVGRIYNADRSEYVCIKQSNFDNVHKDGWWIDGSTMTSTAWLIAAELSSNQGAGDSVTTAGAILSSRWMEMIMNRRTNNHKGT